MPDADGLQFVHVWRTEIRQSFLRSGHAKFVILHKFAYFEWQVSIGCEFPFRFNRTPEVCQLSLEPALTHIPDHVLRPSRVTFEVKVFKGDEVRVNEGPFVAVSNADLVLYRVPTNTKMGMIVQNLYNSDIYNDCIVEVTTVLSVPPAEFENFSFPFAAPPSHSLESIKSEAHRFAFLRAPPNFKIICRDGVFETTREGLNLGSLFFRALLRNAMDCTETHAFNDASLVAVKTVATFMFSGTFLEPNPLTQDLVSEIALVGLRFRPDDRRALTFSIEQVACEQLKRVADDLDEVLKWLLAASDSDMPRLGNAAMAIVMERHFNQFLVDYSSPTPKPKLRDIHERLHRRQGMFRPPPYMKLLQTTRLIHGVQTLIASVE